MSVDLGFSTNSLQIAESADERHNHFGPQKESNFTVDRCEAQVIGRGN